MVKVKIKYNIPKLERIISDISVLTGISIAFLDTEYNELCSRKKYNDFCSAVKQQYGNNDKCRISDDEIISRCKVSKSFESHICYAGLFDAVSPVIKNGIIVGYVMMGRVRSCKSPKTNTAFRALYEEIPFFTENQISSLRTLLQEILFETAITFDFDETIDDVIDFIENNLCQRLTISDICAKFGISKNYLYDGLKKYCGMTVNEYIISLRIESAKALLKETKYPVYTVCERVGIENYPYFCRLFKKRVNISPAEYRKRYSNAEK